MTATRTFDVFCSLDGFGSYDSPGDWGGYWGKQGPEFLEHRLAQYRRSSAWSSERRPSGSSCSTALEKDDSVVHRMMTMPTSVVSTSLDDLLKWPHAVLERGDAVEVVGRLKQESPVPCAGTAACRSIARCSPPGSSAGSR